MYRWRRHRVKQHRGYIQVRRERFCVLRVQVGLDHHHGPSFPSRDAAPGPGRQAWGKPGKLLLGQTSGVSLTSETCLLEDSSLNPLESLNLVLRLYSADSNPTAGVISDSDSDISNSLEFPKPAGPCPETRPGGLGKPMNSNL
jgi:hypothetical protein